jgi:hypothetical protein
MLLISGEVNQGQLCQARPDVPRDYAEWEQ